MDGGHRFGQRGETLAASYLSGRGWRIVARNWRFHHKEIDLVAERDGVVAFVEVKSRGPAAWAHPLGSIDAGKRRDLAVAARGWIALHGRSGQSYRFDAITVRRVGARTLLEHSEDAWRL
ncbi:MAG: YraN family protein [Gemmatimonadota bacterium]